MKKIFLTSGLIVAITLLGVFTVLPPAVSAISGKQNETERETEQETEQEVEQENEQENKQESEHESGHESGRSVTQRVEDRKAEATKKVEAAKTKLADAKLKACQNREASITNIMARLSDRGQKQVDLFTKIAERTETFYTNKGKTLATYDTLVADVSAKKSAAQEAVDTVKSTSVEFKCDGDNPKGVAFTFKESLKTQIAALKEYRTAVKNLIVGVKSVQSTTQPVTTEEKADE